MVVTHPHNTFSEDALWYQAQTLIKLNRINDGKLTLEKIIENNGFYAAKAKEKLKELK
jgi:hypothetical protein